MKKTVAAALALLLLFLCVFSVGAVDAAPASGMVAAAHGAVAATVGVDTPGAAVVLLEGGALKMADGFGYASLDTRVLVTPDTVFEIGDLSSLFVAIAALKLAEGGRLSLDADIATYLPARVTDKLQLTYPVTVRQLLCGRAGFGGRLFDVSFDKAELGFESLEEALLADVPAQVVMPDTVTHYSAFGISLAALVIECVTGASYEKFVQEEVLTPLGMSDTILRASANEVLKNAAIGYIYQADGSFAAAGNDGRSYAGLYPASGALSTASDLAQLFGWLLSDNGPLLGNEAKQVLFSNSNGGLFDRGGMVLTVEGTRAALKAATAYFSLSLSLDMATDLAVLVLANVSSTALLDLPLTLAPLSSVSHPLPEGEMLDLKSLRGTYVTANAEYRTFVGRLNAATKRITVSVNEDGTLQMMDMRLVQIARGVFADANRDANQPVVRFLVNEDGEVSAIVTAEGEVFTALPFYLSRVPSTLLYGLLLLLTAWFLLGGLFSLLRYVTDRYNADKTERAVVLVPRLLAFFLALFVTIQLLVAYRMGIAALSSFYFAMRVMTLLAAIGATVAYIIGFVATMIDREIHRRIAYTGIMLVAFLFVIGFWGLTVI